MPQTKTFVLLSRSFVTWLIVCISSDTEPSTQKAASQHMGDACEEWLENVRLAIREGFLQPF